jgi:hypothetical protein
MQVLGRFLFIASLFVFLFFLPLRSPLNPAPMIRLPFIRASIWETLSMMQ